MVLLVYVENDTERYCRIINMPHIIELARQGPVYILIYVDAFTKSESFPPVARVPVEQLFWGFGTHFSERLRIWANHVTIQTVNESSGLSSLNSRQRKSINEISISVYLLLWQPRVRLRESSGYSPNFITFWSRRIPPMPSTKNGDRSERSSVRIWASSKQCSCRTEWSVILLLWCFSDEWPKIINYKFDIYKSDVFWRIWTT